MATLQDLFDSCRRIYKDMYETMRLMAEEFATRVKNGDWDPSITTYKFDIVVQYSLLQVALADFDFSRNELIFIRDLTEQGDIVEYWNKGARDSSERISWEDLYNADAIDLRKFLRASRSDILDMSDEIVHVFEIMDALHTEHDYASLCEKSMFLLIHSLGMMDGEYTEEEKNEPNVILGVFDRIKQFTRSH